MHRSFIHDLTIRQEPRGELGRYLLAADRALHDKEIVLSRVPFEELRRVYSSNTATWPALMQFFDSDIAAVPDDTGAAFVAYSSCGEAVAATAVRVWDLGQSNLKVEAESLRLYFGDPLAPKAEGWECVMPPISAEMTGQMLYCGAYWVRPDWRGKGLGHLVPAVSRFYALARWNVDYKITFGSHAFLMPNIRDLYQYEDYQDGAHFKFNGATDFEGLLLWARRSYMVDALPRLTAQLTSASRLSGDKQEPLLQSKDW
jgi:GNAT superfamily N-acetyltransferase